MFKDVLFYAVILMILYVAMRFFSLKSYIINHKNLFNRNNKLDVKLLVAYNIFIPTILTYLTYAECGLNENIINMITISLSILTAMLFTLLALLFDKSKEITENKKVAKSKNRIMKEVVKETYYTIMYNIFISCILLLMLFMYYTTNVTEISSLVIYFLLYTFILNLILILSNIYKVFNYYIDTSDY